MRLPGHPTRPATVTLAAGFTWPSPPVDDMGGVLARHSAAIDHLIATLALALGRIRDLERTVEDDGR